MKFKRLIPYRILIDPTPNSGFIVTVDCAKFAYSGYTQLIKDLTAYFENPEDFEKQYHHDISSMGRVHIGCVPDIRTAPYGAGNTASGLSMLARDMLEKQKEIEKEHDQKPLPGGEVEYPLPSTPGQKETEL